MTRITFYLCAAVVTVALAAGAASAGERPVLAQETEDGKIVTSAGVFDSWGEYMNSQYFRDHGARCGTQLDAGSGTAPLTPPAAPMGGGSPADCTAGFTNPAVIYDADVARYRIAVAFHVIQTSSGSGFVSEDQVRSQIDILNEDFLAFPGTNGALGNDAQVEFYLATEDPFGNPTSGITYSQNTTWYNDGGSYWNSLAWDPSRYLNIYSNSAAGALGYVPFLPQQGSPGANSDRVVVLWTTVGRDAPFAPYNQGRTVTHEVGHYLGLWHTFDFGCGSATSCYTSGDRICDTEQESNPSGGCPTTKTSCGSNDPEENYMDYSDDLCMTEFTVEQNRRMRCTLEGYRSQVFALANSLCGNDTLDDGEQCDDGNLIPGDGCNFQCLIEAAPDEVSPTFSLEPLRFLDKKRLAWEDKSASRSLRFNVYRNTTADLAAGDYGSCFRSDLDEAALTVAFNPPAGGVWSFLVTGENGYGEGTLGGTSGGNQRPNTSACP